MKTILKSQYLYLKSKKNADLLKNETVTIEDEEFEDLIQFSNKEIIPINNKINYNDIDKPTFIFYTEDTNKFRINIINALNYDNIIIDDINMFNISLNITNSLTYPNKNQNIKLSSNFIYEFPNIYSIMHTTLEDDKYTLNLNYSNNEIQYNCDVILYERPGVVYYDPFNLFLLKIKLFQVVLNLIIQILIIM